MKFPRIAHLPWSPGCSGDDIRSGDISRLIGKRVVITEKLDGENTSLYNDRIHARSEDSRHHPSRDWVKALHGRIQAELPPDIQLIAENVYAEHSIRYTRLTTYAYVIMSIYQGEVVESWGDTASRCKQLGLQHVPIIDIVDNWSGTHADKYLAQPRYADETEGYVVRLFDAFLVADFESCIFKYVRANHVQTTAHWTRSWERNTLGVQHDE